MRQVLRLLRGSLYSRQGAQPYFLLRSRRSAATGGPWLYGDSTPRPERELLPRSRWKEELCRSAGGGGFGRWDSACALYYLSSAGFWTRYCRGHRRRAGVVRPRALASAERVFSCFGGHAAALYAGRIPGADFVDSGGAS